MDSSGTTGTTTYGTTIIQGIIIFILLIGLVFLLYYLATRPFKTPFPISPFNYGDVIQIVPAVLSQYAGINPSADQYLTRNNCTSSDGSGHCTTFGCYQNDNPFSGVNSCALTFTGNKNDPKTKWILREFTHVGGGDASVSLTSGFGNRFYLQSSTTGSETDPSGRVGFNVFNNSGICKESGDRSFPYVGTNDNNNNCFQNEMLIYMKPTSQPDLYYILFPTSFTLITPLNYHTNDGVMTLRPFAQYTADTAVYIPWDSTGTVNNNGPLLNTIPSNYPLPSGPFNTPETFLFKITKA